MDEKQKKEYQEYVKQVTPTHNIWLQMLKAFVVGGIICVIGQAILNTCAGMGLDIGVVGAKQRFGPLARDPFYLIHKHTPAIITSSRYALGIFIGQMAAHGLHHSF